VLRLFFFRRFTFKNIFKKWRGKARDINASPMDLLRGAIFRCLFFPARFCGFHRLPAAFFFLKKLGAKTQVQRSN
jgi:hypothetical protein